MRKIFLVLLLFALSFSLLPSINAQRLPDRDGDGVPDRSDDCPDVAGSPSNRGCPESPTPQPDRDGDGTIDVLDRCPSEGGPASNAGCPEGETPPSTDPTEEPESQVPQAVLPTDGRCVLATAGRERVNVRDIPDLQGAIVGQLSPSSIYPVHFHIIGDSEEDSWYLVDLGWVSAQVARLGGNCRAVPYIVLPEDRVIHFGDLGFVFLGDGSVRPPTVHFPTDQFPTDQLPPFFMQACEGKLQISWLLPAVQFCDGSVIPTDQMPSDENGNVLECDGSVIPFGEVEGDGSVRTLSSILIGLLLPAVQLGDGSVMPADSFFDIFFGDGSVLPCPQYTSFGVLLGTNIITDGTSNAAGAGGGGGTGKVSFHDISFFSFFDADSRYGILIIGLPQDPSEEGLLLPAVQVIFDANPPDPVMDWTQIGSMIIGQHEGDVYVCPAGITDGTSQGSAPTTGLEQVGFNPQPEPPAQCMVLNY